MASQTPSRTRTRYGQRFVNREMPERRSSRRRIVRVRDDEAACTPLTEIPPLSRPQSVATYEEGHGSEADDDSSDEGTFLTLPGHLYSILFQCRLFVR
jgi:hypothetical protein